MFLRVRERETGVLSGDLFTNFVQARDDLIDEPVWRGSSGSHADTLRILKIRRIDLRGCFNQKAVFTLFLTYGQQLDAV